MSNENVRVTVKGGAYNLSFEVTEDEVEPLWQFILAWWNEGVTGGAKLVERSGLTGEGIDD